MRRHVIWTAQEPVSTILVGRGTSVALVEVVDARPSERVAILCQPTTRELAELYSTVLKDAGHTVSFYTVPDGEEAKRLGVVERVYRFLNDAEFTREDLILGIGGGALTDVTGFIGGTYLRGVRVMYVATTLLGAVDAAIGGKTGVNVDGKNLAGVFAHPEVVIIDIDILERLPERLKREGAAEALKAGFIDDIAIVEA